MPIIKSAQKKLRQDKKRFTQNQRYLVAYKKLLKKLQKSKSVSSDQIKKIYSNIDRALKKNIIHKSKAKRMKSQAAKLVKTSRASTGPKSKSK